MLFYRWAMVTLAQCCRQNLTVRVMTCLEKGWLNLCYCEQKKGAASWVYKHLFPQAGRALSTGEGCRGSVLQHKGTDRAVHLPFPQALLIPVLGHQNDWRAITASVSTLLTSSQHLAPKVLFIFPSGPSFSACSICSLFPVFPLLLLGLLFQISFISVLSFRKIKDSRVLQTACFGWWHTKVENYWFSLSILVSTLAWQTV